MAFLTAGFTFTLALAFGGAFAFITFLTGLASTHLPAEASHLCLPTIQPIALILAVAADAVSMAANDPRANADTERANNAFRIRFAS